MVMKNKSPAQAVIQQGSTLRRSWWSETCNTLAWASLNEVYWTPDQQNFDIKSTNWITGTTKYFRRASIYFHPLDIDQ